MKKIYISTCTEHEFGWGSKNDGYAVSFDINQLNDYIQTDGNYIGEYHEWSYEIPKTYFVEDNEIIKILETFILERMNKFNILLVSSLKELTNDICGQFKLYSEVD